MSAYKGGFHIEAIYTQINTLVSGYGTLVSDYGTYSWSEQSDL